jgi:hypothetical protein
MSTDMIDTVADISVPHTALVARIAEKARHD